MASFYDGGTSSSDSEAKRETLADFSYRNLATIPDALFIRAHALHSLQLDNNNITSLPSCIGEFRKLITLDISSNNMVYICDEITNLTKLRTFICKNNKLSKLPKDFGLLRALEVVNVSGNHLDSFPPQITELTRLKVLQIGGNKLKQLPSDIKRLLWLQVLYLGGNNLTEIPAEVGQLSELTRLVLCDNVMQSLPPTLKNLHKLRSLSLHNNQLSTLPTEIVSLDLVELSLRNNPLVNRFVQDLVYNPPSLLEMAGRVITVQRVPYTRDDLPVDLIRYLSSAHCCVNPQCKGVYFSSRVEQVKFVDFCGKYRLPLLQYLCSPSCSTDTPQVCKSSGETDQECEDPACAAARRRMRRVLLG